MKVKRRGGICKPSLHATSFGGLCTKIRKRPKSSKMGADGAIKAERLACKEPGKGVLCLGGLLHTDCWCTAKRTIYLCSAHVCCFWHCTRTLLCFSPRRAGFLTLLARRSTHRHLGPGRGMGDCKTEEPSAPARCRRCQQCAHGTRKQQKRAFFCGGGRGLRGPLRVIWGVQSELWSKKAAEMARNKINTHNCINPSVNLRFPAPKIEPGTPFFNFFCCSAVTPSA